MALTAQDKSGIIDEYATAEGDTGSAEVQVALLTHRIKYLTEHFQTHKKDHASRRDAHEWVPVGTGAWDRDARPSYADASRLLRVPPDARLTENLAVRRCQVCLSLIISWK